MMKSMVVSIVKKKKNLVILAQLNCASQFLL